MRLVSGVVSFESVNTVRDYMMSTSSFPLLGRDLLQRETIILSTSQNRIDQWQQQRCISHSTLRLCGILSNSMHELVVLKLLSGVLTRTLSGVDYYFRVQEDHSIVVHPSVPSPSISPEL